MSNEISNLIQALLTEPRETEWLEFKKDNCNAKMIGQDICALANGAALLRHDQAYMIWGIDDVSHSITGTEFSPYDKFQGNQELISWLHGLLSDNAIFSFIESAIDGKRIVILNIKQATIRPVTFQKEPYIRVGSYTKRLAEHPSLQSRLWSILQSESFELAVAMKNLSINNIDDKLDISTYFNKLSIPTPDSLKDCIPYLERDQLIKRQDDHQFSITNLGAILLAKDLNTFDTVKRKEIRIVRYKNTDRIEIERSKSYEQGYAVCIETVLEYLDALLPSQEPIRPNGNREIVRAYPPEAIRELLLNALIHQDLSSPGNCVLFEIFDNRIEITNPGNLLVNKNRIIDFPPKSRNELFAKIMRRMKLCEELGTGWDRVVSWCEKSQLPSPEIITYPDSTKVVIFSHIDFSELSKEQRIWACYLHACILKTNNLSATNSTLRQRFGTDKTSTISRLLKETESRGLIKLKDADAGKKSNRYIPFWA